MKRTLLLGSAWTASAAAAVGLGFLAISFVDASASDTGPVAPAAATTVATDDPTGTAAPAPPASVAGGQQVTDGGTVYGSCDGAVPVLASAPAAGWWLDDSSDPGQVEFRNGAQQVEVRVTCVDGAVRFAVEGPRAEDRGSDDGTASRSSSAVPSSTVPSVSRPTSGADDHGSGGSAADDAPGDDSRGRTGGGHGADD